MQRSAKKSVFAGALAGALASCSLQAFTDGDAMKLTLKMFGDTPMLQERSKNELSVSDGLGWSALDPSKLGQRDALDKHLKAQIDGGRISADMLEDLAEGSPEWKNILDRAREQTGAERDAALDKLCAPFERDSKLDLERTQSQILRDYLERTRASCVNASADTSRHARARASARPSESSSNLVSTAESPRSASASDDEPTGTGARHGRRSANGGSSQNGSSTGSSRTSTPPSSLSEETDIDRLVQQITRLEIELTNSQVEANSKLLRNSISKLQAKLDEKLVNRESDYEKLVLPKWKMTGPSTRAPHEPIATSQPKYGARHGRRATARS